MTKDKLPQPTCWHAGNADFLRSLIQAALPMLMKAEVEYLTGAETLGKSFRRYRS